MKTTIANLATSLTHSVDRLEVAANSFVVICRADEEHYLTLNMEIGHLHLLIDQLNALYEDVADREADAAFENAGC